MKSRLATEEIIESLVSACLSEGTSARQQHLLRENLRNLIRLAKAEQVMEIKDSVNRLTGAMETQEARRRAKAILLAQRLPGLLDQAQQKFEFKQ